MYTITEQDYKDFFGVSDAPQPFQELIDESKILFISKLGVDVDLLTLSEPCKTRVKNAILVQTRYLVDYITNGADGILTPTYVAIGEFLYSMKKDSNFNAHDDIISPRALNYLKVCGLYSDIMAIAHTRVGGCIR